MGSFPKRLTLFRASIMWCLIIALGTPDPCCGQESAQRNSDEDFVWTVIRELDRSTVTLNLTSGIIRPSFSQRFRTDNVVDYFHSKEVLDELDIAEAQKKPLSQIVEKWKQEIDDIRKKLYPSSAADQLTKEQWKELVEKSRRISDQYLFKVKEVLLTHQLDRLKKIQLNVLLRNVGPYSFLTSKSVREEIELSREQLEKLFFTKRKGLMDAKKIIKSDLPRLMKEVTNELTESQKKEFVKRWPTLGEGTEPWIGVLAYQCSAEFLKRSKEADKKTIAEQVQSLPVFYLKLNGQLADYSRDLVNHLESLVLLQSLIKDPKLAQQLSLSEAQLADLDKTYDENWEAMRKLREKSKNDEDWTHYERFKQMNSRECRKRMESILLEFQKEIIDSQLGVVVSRSRGPIFDLAIGDFGEQIGIKTERRRAIEKKAGKLHDELVKLSKRVEKEVIDEFVGVLNEQQKKEFRAMIDVSYDRPGCIGVLLYRLAN